ncbi:hypothetical protein DSO57_1027983 [Entomophthora muscae]|uniref:Uncharacterized protein n=1 Tax=Entomophthora muscae TaxID=34485 RepID=A0ACC2RGF5_9FUNG|nr:hypothetical protein DSO57_1027983 [Entomophthora muscae]
MYVGHAGWIDKGESCHNHHPLQIQAGLDNLTSPSAKDHPLEDLEDNSRSCGRLSFNEMLLHKAKLLQKSSHNLTHKWLYLSLRQLRFNRKSWSYKKPSKSLPAQQGIMGEVGVALEFLGNLLRFII